jgi:hypothetical protein
MDLLADGSNGDGVMETPDESPVVEETLALGVRHRANVATPVTTTAPRSSCRDSGGAKASVDSAAQQVSLREVGGAIMPVDGAAKRDLCREGGGAGKPVASRGQQTKKRPATADRPGCTEDKMVRNGGVQQPEPAAEVLRRFRKGATKGPSDRRRVSSQQDTLNGGCAARQIRAASAVTRSGLLAGGPNDPQLEEACAMRSPYGLLRSYQHPNTNDLGTRRSPSRLSHDVEHRRTVQNLQERCAALEQMLVTAKAQLKESNEANLKEKLGLREEVRAHLRLPEKVRICWQCAARPFVRRCARTCGSLRKSGFVGSVQPASCVQVVLCGKPKVLRAKLEAVAASAGRGTPSRCGTVGCFARTASGQTLSTEIFSSQLVPL